MLLFSALQMVLNLGSLQNSHDGRISCLGLSGDGSALCTGSWDTTLKVCILCTKLKPHLCAHMLIIHSLLLDCIINHRFLYWQIWAFGGYRQVI